MVGMGGWRMKGQRAASHLKAEQVTGSSQEAKAAGNAYAEFALCEQQRPERGCVFGLQDLRAACGEESSPNGRHRHPLATTLSPAARRLGAWGNFQVAVQDLGSRSLKGASVGSSLS